MYLISGFYKFKKISNLKKLYFKFCERLVSLINVDLIFDSKVIDRYYSFHFKTKGSLIYYPSDFSDKIIFNKRINNTNKVFKKAMVLQTRSEKV